MTVTAIVGANWGDEGKGKMTDLCAADCSYVVRYQGGSNAGHTIINEFGKFSLHMLPSGVFHPNIMNVIGPGVALDIEQLLKECEELRDRGVSEPELCISERAQVVLPIHRLFDELEEERLGASGYGSTKRGIAPFYSDKYAKLGIQVADLFDERRLRDKMERLLAIKNVLLVHLYGKPAIQLEESLAHLLELGSRIASLVIDTTELLRKGYATGKRILLEGSLGALRDPDHGIYPYSTSSSTLAGFASVGAGLPPYAITEVMAVVKAYSSCVGAGPFVTELVGADSNELRRRGGDAGEYGSTTGRPRRVGWFDAVATRYGCQLQGATEVALTNLDVLGYLDEIPVCLSYEVDGVETDRFPTTASLERAQPIFTRCPGWKCDIGHIRQFEQLPQAARDYVQLLQSEIGVPIKYVSVGPHRDQLISVGRSSIGS